MKQHEKLYQLKNCVAYPRGMALCGNDLSSLENLLHSMKKVAESNFVSCVRNQKSFHDVTENNSHIKGELNFWYIIYTNACHLLF